MDIIKKIKNFTYNERHCLGEGSFGKVYEGKADDGHKVAIKKVQQRVVSNDSYLKNALETQITIMKKLHHPNIVYLEDVVITANSIYLIMEYCMGGDLKKYSRGRKLSQQQATEVIKQIVCGFQQISKHGIVHRDLKPANILVHQGTFKICDFGFARFFTQNKMSRTCVGTPVYMSPQVLNQKPYTQKTDIWSLGILYYELLFAKFPYTGSTEAQLYNNILKTTLNIPSSSKFVLNFLRGTLQVDQSTRWPWKKVFQTFQLKENELSDKKMSTENLFYKKNSKEQIEGPKIKNQQKNDIKNIPYYRPEQYRDQTNRSIKKNDPPKPKPKNLLAFQTSQENIKYYEKPIEKPVQLQNPRFLYFIIVELLVNPIQLQSYKHFIASLYRHTITSYEEIIQNEQGLYVKVLQSQLEELKNISSQIPKVKESDARKTGQVLIGELNRNNVIYKGKGWIQRFLKNDYKYNPLEN